jgi:CAAX prenyl protease-like protein
MRSWRENCTAAHVGPFLAFMVLLAPVGWFKIDNPLRPWWQYQPEHWIYPIQTVVCLALIAWWWKQYQFGPVSRRVILWGAGAGVGGFFLWILPSILAGKLGAADWGWPQWLTNSMGLASRAGPGFDPDIFAGGSTERMLTVALRFLRMAVAVPLLEEIFWRGFLWRYLADGDRDFWKVPFGVRNPRAIFLTILFFILAHHQTDWLGCLIYGVIISVVALRTRSLAACVVCHAVTNLLLGIYVMQTKQWGFW